MKLFDEDELDRAIEEIDEMLKEETKVYLIGGLAMIYHGSKTSTKDIDLVLKDKEDYNRLKQALTRSGYESIQEKTDEYQGLNAKIVMDDPEKPRFDIFLNEVCGQLWLSEGMVERSESIMNLDNLRLHILSREDIFLFKIVATRDRDMDDASVLFESGLDWPTIRKETEIQSELTGKKWFPLLYQCLEEFEEEYSLTSPIKEDVYERAMEQIEGYIERADKDQ